MLTSANPARATISPAPASGTSTRFSPSKTVSEVTFCRVSLAVRAELHQRVAGADGAPLDAADGDPPAMRVVVERGDQHLRRSVRIDVRRRHLAHDRLEEGAQVGRERGRIGLGAGAPLAGDGEEDRELELLGVGRQLQEEILEALHRLRRCGMPGGRSC